MKIAFIHYWLITNRGGEQVLENFCKIFPDADIYTHVYDPQTLNSKIINSHNVKTTFIGKLPFAKKIYKYYLPLMNLSLYKLDLSEYDLVISFESGPTINVITNVNTPHLCYCHTPMRYLYDQKENYTFKNSILDLVWTFFKHRLITQDFIAAQRIDQIIANSSFIQKRIMKYWNRTSTVINPPIKSFNFNSAKLNGIPHEYFIYIGALEKYKGIDELISAFSKREDNLVIISPKRYPKYETKKYKNIYFFNNVSDDELRTTLTNSKALIHPGVEDFGIVMAEAVSLGIPVIANKYGGSSDIIRNEKEGLLFYPCNEKTISRIVDRFNKSCLANSPETETIDRFSETKFQNDIKVFIMDFIRNYQNDSKF